MQKGTWFVTVDRDGGNSEVITVEGRDVRRIGHDCYSVDGDQRRVNGRITNVERGNSTAEEVARTAKWAGGRNA